MTAVQWQTLLATLRGDAVRPLPVGFIIDSPWLPHWCGRSIRDYFTSDEVWLAANIKAVREFPDVMFLPGFWSEYGMCTEPSAFGVRCTFPPDEFPHVHTALRSADDIAALPVPDPRADGLLPFVLNRLKLARPAIEEAGHAVRFAVARGPLNVACHLMGTTEFLTLMMEEPVRAEALLDKVTTFLRDWIDVQREAFATIDGILLLDDIIGFLGEAQFRQFALPRFSTLFARDVAVRFLHNDAPCRVSAPYLAGMGVNLFNMGFDIPLSELRTLAGPGVTLMGNLPPRDVLARCSPPEVTSSARAMAGALAPAARVIFSCGGGMPPDVTGENIRAFAEGVRGAAG